jgi:hypothetical protein
LKTDVDQPFKVKNNLEKAQKHMKEVGRRNLPNSWPWKKKRKVEQDRNVIVTIEPSIKDLEAIVMDQTTKALDFAKSSPTCIDFDGKVTGNTSDGFRDENDSAISELSQTSFVQEAVDKRRSSVWGRVTSILLGDDEIEEMEDLKSIYRELQL